MAARNLGARGASAQPPASRGLAATGDTRAAVLHIDWVRCDGRGLCTELLPQLLARDEWGYPLALVDAQNERSDIPVPIPLTDAALDAVALCPKQALQLRKC